MNIHNSLETQVADVVKDAAESIQHFNWRVCQFTWSLFVEKAFSNGTTLETSLAIVHQSQLHCESMMTACCSCVSKFRDEMGNDDFAAVLMGLCLETKNRAAAFIYLAMNYYNARLTVGDQPVAVKLIDESYKINASYYDENNCLPTSAPPTDEEIEQIARRERIDQFTRQIMKENKGCLIPVIALGSSMVALVIAFVCLV